MTTGHGLWAVKLSACLVLLAGCGKGSASSGSDSTATEADTVAAPSSLSLPVVGEEVRKGDLVLTVSTTGQIRSEAVVPIKLEATGVVTDVLARAGDRVKKGQVILKLDPRPFDLAVVEAEAALKEAQLRLLDNTLPDSLVSGKAVTGERLRNAEVRSGVEAARARLDRAKYERERATIAAPFDGTLDELRISAGERVNAGQELGKLGGPRQPAHRRRCAGARSPPHPARWRGIDHDGRLARPAGTRPNRDRAAAGRQRHPRGRALIRVQGNGVLRPGMYADVRLEATRLTGRIVVPARAVIERDNRPLVFVVRDGRAQWTYIQPGRTNGLETEVLPDSTTGQIPLNPGDMVLVEGHLTLTHDAPVRVVPRAETKKN
jgi:multidrug efflux pump subunit AcrA (membrane-fusion protein)